MSARAGSGGPDLARMVHVNGHAFSVADDKPTFWDRVVAGQWEPDTFAVLDRYVGRGTVVLDLGAWVGPVSLYAAARGARVLAVEADPAALVQLHANLAANGALASRIAVVARAVSATREPVRMGARRKPGDSMSSSLLADAARSWDAEAIPPDELLALAGFSDRLFVKVDIEGGEYALLPSLAGALSSGPAAGRARAVLVSLHPEMLVSSGTVDVEAATRAALSGFVGWDVFQVGRGAIARRDLAAVSSEGGRSGDWLFVRGWPRDERHDDPS